MEDNFIGQRFGRLVVTERYDDYVAPSGGVHKRYLCKCDCGKETVALKEHLTSGRKKSCGCLLLEGGITTHGEIKTRLYRIWGNMVNRCTNPNNPAWDNYGGRGITVCDDWRDYIKFRDWAHESGYRDDLTIDRIDINGGYYPTNCRWADIYTQANNKRSNHIIEYNGESKTIAEWARKIGFPYKTLHYRLVGLRWDPQRALTRPLRA